MTPKAAKRLERLLKGIDRLLDQMDHADLRPIVEAWNGPPNIRQNLIDFADWQQSSWSWKGLRHEPLC